MYIKREALLEKRRKVSDYDEAGWCVNYQAVPVEDIQSAPAADVVPVVRCRDCAYYSTDVVNEKGFRICPASGMEITEDDFCSYGERRDSDG